MFKIGEFARITRVSTRTLRHYEDLGLLRPHRLEDNDYRVYATDDLERMKRITVFRGLGFSLERIKRLIEGLSQREFLDLIAVQRFETQHEIGRLNTRLDALNALLEEAVMYAPEVRSLPSQRVLAMKSVVPDYQHVAAPMHQMADALCQHLESHCSAQRAGQEIAIWHGDYGELEAFTLEWALPISGDAPETAEIAVYDLPAIPEIGVVLHTGSYERLGEAYSALAAWLDANGYERIGHLREVYVHFAADERDHQTEVQIPVRRIRHQ